MAFRKYITLAACTFMLGLSACGTQDASDVTESEKEQENLTESEVETETNVTELPSEKEDSESFPNADRVVYDQTFEVNLEGWGDVTFVTYKPENEGGDAEYKLFQDGEEVYTFESWKGENYTTTKAVAFQDYNGDGYKDVIIISQYLDTYEQTPEYYDVAQVFIQNPEEQTFLRDKMLGEALSKNQRTDSIASVMGYRNEYVAWLAWFEHNGVSYAESKLIADASDIWLNSMDYTNEVEQYAVTDLDKNGRAEIIVSNMGGSGYYTYTRIFEVNENHDGLEEVTTDFIEGDSQPDMITFEESVPVYIDKDFVHHYIVEDYLKATAAEYYYVIYDVTLQDGHLSHRVLARKNEIYSADGSKKVTYTDAAGQEITEEVYQNIAETVFADRNRVEQHIWGWQDLKELKDLSNEEMRKKLDESFLKRKIW